VPNFLNVPNVSNVPNVPKFSNVLDDFTHRSIDEPRSRRAVACFRVCGVCMYTTSVRTNARKSTSKHNSQRAGASSLRCF
jgi:hypothetical protein